MPADNPFQSPATQASSAADEAADVGHGKLYSKGGILWAGFFGSFLGAGFAMYLNFKRARMPLQAHRALLSSIVVTVAFIGIVMVLPDRIPNLVYTGFTLLVLNFIYDRFQGELFTAHIRNNGARGSNWACVGFGLVALVLIMAVAVGLGFAFAAMGWIKAEG
jgi:hypothetical protein